MLNPRDSSATTTTKPTSLTIQTDIQGQDKRQSTSTHSETSTDYNNSSPLPSGSFMDMEDDYEYYRYYYNYHQQQHQGASSHIVENLRNLPPQGDTTLSTTPPKVRSLTHEPIREETSVASPSHDTKLDILSISTSGTQNSKRRLSDEDDSDALGPIKSASKQPNIGKRKSHPPSSTSVNTYTTAESYHSAVSEMADLELQQSVDPEPSGFLDPKLSQANLNDQRFSTNSRNTLKNIYTSYLNEPEDERKRTSSIYDSTSNRNTVTPSVLETMSPDLTVPLPDINKYVASQSTLSLRDNLKRNVSVGSVNSEDFRASQAYASGALAPQTSNSTHSRSRSMGSQLSTDKRNSKTSENIVGNRLSQGFYFESEEPVTESRKSSNTYSRAQTKFPLLTAASLSGIASGPGTKFRDTVGSTNTFTSSNYRSSYQPSFANTNVTAPTETFSTPNKVQQAQPRFSSKDYSLRLQDIDDESKFDTYDKKLQELQKNLKQQAEYPDEDDEEPKSRDAIKDDNDSIFVPPYLNNTAHTQSSSFSSLRKGQESFKSSKSNNNLAAATLAAATGAVASEAALAINAPHSEVPNLLGEDKKLQIRPVPYGKENDQTIRSTSGTGYPRPSAGFSSYHTPTPQHNSKYHSATSPTTPFSPLSINHEKYIKSINDGPLPQPSGSTRLKSFNLRPPLHRSADIEKLPYDDYHYDDNQIKVCSSGTALMLLFIALFVPPLYLVMCFGFLDSSVGYVPRQYKIAAAGMSIFVTILSIVGICVGFGVGVAWPANHNFDFV